MLIPLLCCAVLPGKKRAWIPDEKEAYIEIEIKELKGDKVIVETKDGRVSDHPSTSIFPFDDCSYCVEMKEHLDSSRVLITCVCFFRL